MFIRNIMYITINNIRLVYIYTSIQIVLSNDWRLRDSYLNIITLLKMYCLSLDTSYLS